MNGAKAIVNDINCCREVTPTQLLKTTTTSAGVVAVSASTVWFRKATVLGKKALDGTTNAGNVKLGYSSATDEQPYTIGPDDEVTLEAPVGARYNLAEVYIVVANDGDGVVVIYS